jgi:hypothetical protein
MGKLARLVGGDVRQAVVSLLVGGAVAMAATISAWLQAVPLWQIIPLFLLTLGLSLFVANQFAIRRSHVDRGRRSTPGDIRATVQDWLLRSGYTVRENPQGGTLFALAATDPGKRTVIVTAVQQGQEIFHEQSKLILDWSLEMARYGIDYEISSIHDVTLQTGFLYENSLTHVQFLERIQFVSRALVLLVVLVRRALGIPTVLDARLLPEPSRQSDSPMLDTGGSKP